MDYLGRLFAGPIDYSPTSDFWYGPVGAMSSSGQRIDADGAQKVSAYYRGKDILSTALAMLPFGMNQVLPDDMGREHMADHPLHEIINQKPNGYQDSYQWRRLHMRHLIDYGNAYDFIVPGSRGFVGELRPIHPTLVKPELSDQGTIVYHVRNQKTGQTRDYNHNQIFHLRGASDDGVEGKGVLEYARDSLGLGLALESYASRLFTKGALFSGLISVPGLLNDEASKRMANSFTASETGWHMPKVLEQGATWTPNQMTPEDSQFILSRKYSVNDIARWLGLPSHMLGDLERSTNNNIEFQGQEFVTFSLGPWLSLWEFATNDQLVVSPDRFYAEFVRDALVRGDIAARWSAYMNAVTTGVYTRNEVRELENKKKLPGLDTPLDPANITGKQGGDPTKKAENPLPGRQAKQAASDEDRPQLLAIIHESAARLLRKEIAAMQKYAVKFAADGDAFADAVTTFYASHAELVAHTLQMPFAAAESYCAGQAAAVLTRGMSAIEDWTAPYYAAGLAQLAIDQEEGAAA